jgi:hypothetical protein
LALGSQHLLILEEAELVSARRDCRYRLHRLQPEPLRDVIHWSSEFEVFFDQRVDALGEYLDRKHARRRWPSLILADSERVVDWKPEEVTINASTQGTSSVPDEFADVFTLPKSKVRVITC